MGFTDLAVVAGFVAVFGLVSRRLSTWAVTAPMVFVAFGLAAGPEALDLVALDLDEEFVTGLTEVTLALVLFVDAARIDMRVLRRHHAVPLRMLGLGLPLTVALGTVLALPLFTDFGVWEAALLAAVLAPTDAALGQVVVTSARVPQRIRQAVNVESGLNDGLALPFVTVFVAMAAGENFDAGLFVAEQLGYALAVGLGVGLIGGWAIRLASGRGWMSESFQQLSTLAVALAAFASSGALDGNGFVAAYVAGGAFGFTARDVCGGVYRFSEEEGQLLAMLVFMVFGGAILGPALDDLTWQIALYAVLSLTVVRMVPIALSLAGLGLHAHTIAFLGWFGPRGLASILFGLLVVERSGAVAASDQIFLVMTWTVALSVVAHGFTARPWAGWYGRHLERLGARRRDLAERQELPEHPVRAPRS